MAERALLATTDQPSTDGRFAIIVSSLIVIVLLDADRSYRVETVVEDGDGLNRAAVRGPQSARLVSLVFERPVAGAVETDLLDARVGR